MKRTLLLMSFFFVVSCAHRPLIGPMPMDEFVQGVYHIQVYSPGHGGGSLTAFAIDKHTLVTAGHGVWNLRDNSLVFIAAMQSSDPDDLIEVVDYRHAGGPRDVLLLTTRQEVNPLPVSRRQTEPDEIVCYTEQREPGVAVTRCGKVEYEKFGMIIVDVPAWPGCSGSPIHTRSGRILGVLVLASDDTMIGLTKEAWQ